MLATSGFVVYITFAHNGQEQAKQDRRILSDSTEAAAFYTARDTQAGPPEGNAGPEAQSDVGMYLMSFKTDSLCIKNTNGKYLYLLVAVDILRSYPKLGTS